MPKSIDTLKVSYPFEEEMPYTDESMLLVKRLAMVATMSGFVTNVNITEVNGELHFYIDDSVGTVPRGNDKPIYIDEEGNY